MGLDSERVMSECDPTQRILDNAVIDMAEEISDKREEGLAVLFNNAIVKAFSGKG
jgi:hypothetical protein